MTIKEFIDQNHLTFKAIEVLENPWMDTPDWKARHYQIQVMNRMGESAVFYFSQGLGIKPKKRELLANLLDCLACDAYGDTSFEDFCANFGYDSDSLKAHGTYTQVVANSQRLKKLLGDTAYNQLIDDEVVERL